MKNFSRIYCLTFLVILLTSCGRHHSGDIINVRDEDITIKLTLQYPDQDPTVYLIDEVKNQVQSPNDGYKWLGDCNSIYDSINHVITFDLKKGEKLDLGTVRLDNSRDSIGGWEFSQLEVLNSSNDIVLTSQELESMIKTYFLSIGQKTHYIEIN